MNPFQVRESARQQFKRQFSKDEQQYFLARVSGDPFVFTNRKALPSGLVAKDQQAPDGSCMQNWSLSTGKDIHQKEDVIWRIVTTPEVLPLVTKNVAKHTYNADNWQLTTGQIAAFGVTYKSDSSDSLLRNLVGVRLALDMQLVKQSKSKKLEVEDGGRRGYNVFSSGRVDNKFGQIASFNNATVRSHDETFELELLDDNNISVHYYRHVSPSGIKSKEDGRSGEYRPGRSGEHSRPQAAPNPGRRKSY